MTRPVDIGILFGLAYQAFTDALHADLAAHGFTDLGAAYGYVFRALARESLHLHELASRLGMTDQGASKIVNQMVARGYVERRPDPHDGRAKELRLAARGRAALATARRFHAAYERRLRTRLGHRRVSAARRWLEDIVADTGSDAATARLRAL
ncbi:MAG: helix-turn-helix domain-containing protein [Gemmatimonadaceae bacterium]|nr:helix-turn-helix domain-containing protein [Gemmatimonadaceae bacterium]